ncbi:Ribosome biogenesis protein erb1 [Hypoxylon texense]
MDPLSALALAGNILQFIEFTTKLLSTGVEVYKSATGIVNANLGLEEISQQLSSLSSCLCVNEGNNPGSASENALRSIADLCNTDCARLLSVLNDLKIKDGSQRGWKSFRIALKLAWKDEQEIEKLMTRLRDRQSMMTLHLCAISNEWLRNMNLKLQHLDDQNRDLQLQHLDKLKEISSSVQDIKLKINHSQLSGSGHAFSAAQLDDLATKVSHISVVERDIGKEQAILRSLDYRSRPSRHNNIATAHARTFNWIFGAPNDANNRGDFLKWLRESDGVFWITGKPGSGKSTLMKYLADHEKTRDSVQDWAGPGRVVIASHFFWSSGSSMQTSAQGLYRSLLFDIFRQCPELISEVCPSRWRVADHPYAASQDWLPGDLLDCFQAIKTNSTSSVRFCFFVDGLDEFDGDYIEIAQTLAEIAKSSRIKLCVASRPLNEFRDQFGANMSCVLLVHELTWNDILKYAQSRLQDHPRWSVLGLDIEAAQLFLQNIANMAQGVFLWVTLVTQSLRNGLTNDDTIEDLNARLECLPKTLEAFYKQMLDSVDPIYHRKSADLLQMQMARIRLHPRLSWTMPWAMALIHEREHANPDYAVTMPRQTLTNADIESLREQTSRRLTAKCRGILEIKVHEVVFIHRTALDYLKTPEMVDYIQARSGKGFNASLSLLRAYVGCLKMGINRVTEGHAPVLQNDVYRFNEQSFSLPLFIAANARSEGAEDAVLFKHIECLEGLSMMIVDPEKKDKYLDRLNVWSTPVGSLCGPLCSSPFVGSLIRRAEAGFAAEKLSNNVAYFRRTPRPALWSLMVYRTARLDYPWWKSSVDLLRLLLEHGYDPNEVFLAEQENHRLMGLQGPNDWWKEPDSLTVIQLKPSTSPGFEPHSEQRSVWLDFLISCKITGCLGPRRQVEIALEKNYTTQPLYTQPGCSTIRKKTINTGLEHGVYSLLLRYGADPNAHISPFTTVWVDFVCLPIKHPSVITATERFLEALDDFFKYGADLGASAIGLTLDPGDTVSHLPFCMITGWDTFCEALEDFTSSKAGRELAFIADIAMKMIKQATRARWPLGRLPSIIDRVFPKSLQQPLLDLIAQGQGTDNPATRWKRPFEGTEAGEESKRL